MRVLVTGATGFFGSGIVRRLSGAGHQVIAVGYTAASPDGQVDVQSLLSCRAVFARHPGIDAVVHSAALAHVSAGRLQPDYCMRVNATGPANMYLAAAESGVKRFVFISSVAVYGDALLPSMATEETPLRPASVYGRAKAEAEHALASLDGPPAVTLRPAGMYSSEWLFNVRKRIEVPGTRGRVRLLVDPDRPRFSFCSRANGSAAVEHAIERLAPGAYNVADSHVYSQRDVARALAAAGGPAVPVRIPAALPRAIWRALRGLPRAGALVDAAYWKYCQASTYSVAKLQRWGWDGCPHLLHVASGLSDE
jgi:nucleoside-diphosphate-sugar epimerase